MVAARRDMAVFADKQHAKLAGLDMILNPHCLPPDSAFQKFAFQKIEPQQVSVSERWGAAQQQRILLLPARVGFSRREDQEQPVCTAISGQIGLP